ncbi:multiple sugar transport system permease protein [Actinoplanes tereljensis]|uniref:ABC transporter permease n=1 Tax=Paractinoplanes tereljensis TaxID=571912 RepID=A0A919NMI0_9ACTN|nr:sugar ABC transporter permease [Actinoplanes tereljensis]GIF20850.1 ABC transporter permease [Actinoplanes tereljensis]
MTVLLTKPPALRTAVPKKRKRRPDRAAYLFLLPWLIGIVFTVGPFAVSLYLAFTDYNLLTAPRWSGWDNIREMIGDATLHQSLRVTAIYTLVSVPLSLAAALAVAMVLQRGVRGLSIYRSVYYLPSLLGSSVAIVMLWRYLFGYQGVVNRFLGWFGIQGPGWTSDPHFALSTLILLHVWTFGAPMVIFLAGLKQIPVMYYEAAAMDGASAWRQFRSVTLPLLSPIIFFNLVQSMIASFQTFTQGYVMSGGTGGPAESTLFSNLYLYQKGFGELDMGYASSMAWLLLVIIGGFTAVNFLAARYWVFYEN